MVALSEIAEEARLKSGKSEKPEAKMQVERDDERENKRERRTETERGR